MTPKDTAPDIDLETVSRLRLAVMRLARRLRQQADPDITPSMLSALATIERRGPVSLGALAEAERVRPPTMTEIVRRLENAGFIARSSDPADKRIALLELSSEGRRFLDRVRARKNAYLAQRLRKLDPDDVAALERAVLAIEHLLEEDV